ncbi:DUF4142 domain-containing protein [Novosphingobium sp. PS1R-30]|uniref:DUF4142 domain-containing protein n=1 Tax=Novosphingobium anseongense TaxID=3133436 RepID=A0ABU8S1Y2_9SPHN
MNRKITAMLGATMISMTTPAGAQMAMPAMPSSPAGIDAPGAPTLGLDGPAFLAAASDANHYQIAAARMSLTRAQRSDVKDYARRMIAESETAQQVLMASLTNDQRKIARPSTQLSADRNSMIEMLRKAPRSSFDNLYLTQSAQVQQASWATHKGYSQDGADQSLKQVAGNGVPMIEQQLRQGKALLPTALSAN